MLVRASTGIKDLLNEQILTFKLSYTADHMKAFIGLHHDFTYSSTFPIT